jgi:hypothetical protein
VKAIFIKNLWTKLWIGGLVLASRRTTFYKIPIFGLVIMSQNAFFVLNIRWENWVSMKNLIPWLEVQHLGGTGKRKRKKTTSLLKLHCNYCKVRLTVPYCKCCARAVEKCFVFQRILDMMRSWCIFVYMSWRFWIWTLLKQQKEIRLVHEHFVFFAQVGESASFHALNKLVGLHALVVKTAWMGCE